jgi:hypothetical protein
MLISLYVIGRPETRRNYQDSHVNATIVGSSLDDSRIATIWCVPGIAMTKVKASRKSAIAVSHCQTCRVGVPRIPRKTAKNIAQSATPTARMNQQWNHMNKRMLSNHVCYHNMK